jgi:Ser/Thr protein kinase RdoA (MazF antagonist)
MGYEAVVSDSDLAQIDAAVPSNLWRWGISETAFVKLLNHSENTTYLIQEGDQRFILRVHRLGYHTPRAISAELDWVEAIRRDSSIRTACPIVGVNSERIQPFVTSMAGERHGVMFTFLDGEEPSETADLAGSFEQLGTITAMLHDHSQQWAPNSPKLERPVWDFEHTLGSEQIWGDWRQGLGMTPEMIAQINQGIVEIRRRLRDYGMESDRFGLVHADLRLANLIIHEGKVGVIDFDDCGYSWLMYDLASALSFIEHKEYVPELIRSWVKGYSQVRSLTQEALEMIPTLILLRRILLVAWLGTHSETDLAKELGVEYTDQTCKLVSSYLQGTLYSLK